MKKLSVFLILAFLFTSQISAQRWGANVSGGYSFTVGEFADYYDNGLHGSVSGFYYLGTGLQISLITGYSKWELKNDYFSKKWNEVYFKETVDVEAPVTAIPLLVGFKYFFCNSKKMKPYFMFAAGFHFITKELNGSRTIYYDESLSLPVDERAINRDKEHLTETTIGFGGGISFPLSKIIALDCNAKYNIINDSSALQEIDKPVDVGVDKSTLSYVSLMLGLDIRL